MPDSAKQGNSAALPADPKSAAQARAKAKQLPYAGALLPREAHDLLGAGAKLVDVRTEPELQYVGRIPGSVVVAWQTYPGNKPNPDFIAQLERAVGREETVMFICRSGARSHGAARAAAEAGYKDAYNVLEGFEGDKDASQHRNSVAGWRHAGLPWVQS